MSVVGNNRVGIPIVLLHDAEGSVVSVETKAGELIRGLLFEAEDMMNLYLKNAVIYDRKGAKRKVDQVYVRGCQITFIVLPEMLRHAPMFHRIKHWRKFGGAPPEGVGAAVGQAAAILRKANERRGRGGGGFPQQQQHGGGNGGRGGFHGARGGGGGGGGPPFGGNRHFGGGGRGGSYGAPGQYGPR